jgi:hypothetical protein
MFDIAAFLVEDAQKEFAATGRHLRQFLWQEYSMTEAAMEAFVAAYKASCDATGYQYSITWNESDDETPAFTPEQASQYILLFEKQDETWEAFASLLVSEHPNESQGNLRDAIECEKWAVIQLRRRVETEFYSAVKVLT